MEIEPADVGPLVGTDAELAHAGSPALQQRSPAATQASPAKQPSAQAALAHAASPAAAQASPARQPSAQAALACAASPAAAQASPARQPSPSRQPSASPKPAAPPPRGRCETLVHCPLCAAVGKTYAKVFIGRHLDPETGKEVPVDYLHLPNVPDNNVEDCKTNGKNLRNYKGHFSRCHRGVLFKPWYSGFTLTGTPNSRLKTQQHDEEAQVYAPHVGVPIPGVQGEEAALGAGAYLSEALVQAEDQLRGLDLHPVHPPVGSALRKQKAQCLSAMLKWVGVLNPTYVAEPRSAWLWDTDEWEPAWMSEATLKQVRIDDHPDFTTLTLTPLARSLIGREWRALQTAWRAAERRYASVLDDMRQGRQVPDMNGCYEIQNLRMLARSLAEYVTVCNNESGTVEPTYDTNRDEDDVIYRPTTSHMGQQATKAQGSLEARLMRAAQLMPDKDHARKGKVQAVQAGAQAEAGQAAGVERPPWMDIWEERVWEVATELAEDMYETRVVKKARVTINVVPTLIPPAMATAPMSPASPFPPTSPGSPMLAPDTQPPGTDLPVGTQPAAEAAPAAEAGPATGAKQAKPTPKTRKRARAATPNTAPRSQRVLRSHQGVKHHQALGEL